MREGESLGPAHLHKVFTAVTDVIDACCFCLCACCMQAVLDAGISSIAVVLKHAAIYPEHEKMVGQLAAELGFKQVCKLKTGSL